MSFIKDYSFCGYRNDRLLCFSNIDMVLNLSQYKSKKIRFHSEYIC